VESARSWPTGGDSPLEEEAGKMLLVTWARFNDLRRNSHDLSAAPAGRVSQLS
jgi:hypothetical protein